MASAEYPRDTAFLGKKRLVKGNVTGTRFHVIAQRTRPRGESKCSRARRSSRTSFLRSKADLVTSVFSTKYYDGESGLLYYGRRFYSPSQGRFLGRDPTDEQGGLNLYGFSRSPTASSVCFPPKVRRQSACTRERNSSSANGFTR